MTAGIAVDPSNAGVNLQEKQTPDQAEVKTSRNLKSARNASPAGINVEG
jgi:hypothetical protein